MRVTKPIFVVGAGRSGSTEFHRIFCEHPEVAWLTAFAARRPSRPEINRRWMQAIDLPVMGSALRRRLFRGEFYEFWNHYFRGFGAPYRDLTAADVTERARRVIPAALASTLTPRRHRLLMKITGWPRVGFLQRIFPDARFIHLVRDGRAVANSLVNTDFWHGWHGTHNWRWGELPLDLRYEWTQKGESFVALAGMQWTILMDAMLRAQEEATPGSFLQIRYEDFCANPLSVFREVNEFCELDGSNQFEVAVRRASLRNANEKWRQDLTQEQQASLTAVTLKHLVHFGYEVLPAGERSSVELDTQPPGHVSRRRRLSYCT